MTDFLAIGKLTKPFGLKGGIKTLSFSGESAHFLKLRKQEIQLRRSNGEILSAVVRLAEMKGDVIVMYFQGYDTPEKVAEIRGCELWVDRRLASPLEEGEFYMADLIGCTLLYEKKAVGQVISFFEAAQIILEIQPAQGKAFYIPFSGIFIGDIDLEQKTIELLDGRLL